MGCCGIGFELVSVRSCRTLAVMGLRCFNARLCCAFMFQDDKARGELVVFALDSGATALSC